MFLVFSYVQLLSLIYALNHTITNPPIKPSSIHNQESLVLSNIVLLKMAFFKRKIFPGVISFHFKIDL